MKKTILFITDTSLADPTRGTPLRIMHILKELSRVHTVFICARDSATPPAYFVAYPNKKGLQKLFFFTDLVKKCKPDIVMTSSEVGLKLPVMLKLLFGVKIMVDLHGLYYEELRYQKKMHAIKAYCYELLTSWLLLFYDVVIVVSKKLGDYYVHSSRRAVVVYGGYEPENFQASSITLSPPRTFTIGYMGNTRSYQGVEYLLDALRKIKNEKKFLFSFNAIMSGNEDAIRALINSYGLGQETILHCNVSHTAVGKIIGASDVLVIPRPKLKMTEYAFPSKFPEYLAIGIPVIVTEGGPVDELLANEDCCVKISTIAIGDSLYKALYQLYLLSPADRAAIGARGAAFAQRRLTWEKVTQILINKIDSL